MAEPTDTSEPLGPEANGTSAPELRADTEVHGTPVRDAEAAAPPPRSIADAIPTVAPHAAIEPKPADPHALPPWVEPGEPPLDDIAAVPDPQLPPSVEMAETAAPQLSKEGVEPEPEQPPAAGRESTPVEGGDAPEPAGGGQVVGAQEAAGAPGLRSPDQFSAAPTSAGAAELDALAPEPAAEEPLPPLQALLEEHVHAEPPPAFVHQTAHHRSGEPPAQPGARGLVFVAASPAAIISPLPSVALPPETTFGHTLSYLRLALKAVAVVLLGLAGLVLLLIVLYRWINPPTSTLMLAQRLAGTEIEQSWVPLRHISPHLVRAVILSEDGGFCRHRGVDWAALEQAMETARGGSTITMQVVKNLFLWPSRSYVRKAIEIALAYVVEALWPKRRILEVYLNIAEWGDGIFGAEAAAGQQFGVAAAQLTAHEAALLAVSLPNPIERQAGAPGPGTRRLASNLLVRMKASRTATACVQVRRAGSSSARVLVAGHGRR